jgi:hypothetical protein
MAIRIVISNTVKFDVSGNWRNEAGVEQPFRFSLTCRRLDAEQLAERLRHRDEAPVTEFFAEVIEDWAVPAALLRDDDGKPVPYSPEALRVLFGVPGMASLTLRTYLAESGARAKN